MNYDIFISYRREGGYETAKHLYDLLTRDGYRVSFDIDTLRNGNFDDELYDRIDQCKDFLLILDKNAFAKTLSGRINPKEDWLRLELARAIERKKNVVPIFLTGFDGFPPNLPSDISAVTKKHAPKYDKYYFNDFYNKLKRDFLISKPHSYKWLYVCLLLALVAFVAYFAYNPWNNDAQGNVGAPSTAIVSESYGNDDAKEVNYTVSGDMKEPEPASETGNARHFTFEGIPLNMDIRAFTKRMIQNGYELKAKATHNCTYTYQRNGKLYFAVWDEQTDKVFMVEWIIDKNDIDKNDLYMMYADEYGEIPSTFSADYDAITFDDGAILFGEDENSDYIVIFIDKVNSNNYRLI